MSDWNLGHVVYGLITFLSGTFGFTVLLQAHGLLQQAQLSALGGHWAGYVVGSCSVGRRRGASLDRGGQHGSMA